MRNRLMERVVRGIKIEPVGLAMPGVMLPQRIRRILSGIQTPKISGSRAAFAIAVCAIASAIFAVGTLVHAQSQAAARPKFEVASIKPCNDDIPLGGRGGGGNITPGRMTLNCQTVRGYIGAAYTIFANGRTNLPPLPPVEGGPSWIDSERYTIVAKAEDNADSGMMQGPMLQVLLEDRLKLKIHRETREVPVYELTIAKGGPKLKRHQEGSCVPRPPIDLTKPIERPLLPPGQRFCAAVGTLKGPNMVVDAEAISVNEYTKIFFAGVDRPVIDKTGITGEYDIHLEYAPGDEIRSRLAENGRDPGESSAPSIFTALQEQLGFKLESAKGPREFLVIDRVEKPSEN